MPQPNPSPARQFSPPGQPRIRAINLASLTALYIKEVRRFFKVQLQTIWAPALTTLLFLAIFTVALGGEGRQVLGVPYADFIAPGLIMMAILQSAFANSSFSLLVGKIQGTIVDYLMPPMSSGEVVAALVAAAVTRGVLVGAALWAAMALWPGVQVSFVHGWAVALFAVLGAMMMAFFGLITSIWAEKFDHAAAITNFVVAPLALLSGTFYAVERLSPLFQTISHFNPFYHAIMGLRYGFIGQSDATIAHPIVTAIAVLVLTNLVLGAACYLLMRRGWKIQA